MRNLHMKNSFRVWNPKTMKKLIDERVKEVAWHHAVNAENYLNRSYLSMYIEWYLHNICYYLTLPFIKIEVIKKINLRAKHTDLEEYE